MNDAGMYLSDQSKFYNPRYLMNDTGSPYFANQRSVVTDNELNILDEEWVSRAFLISDKQLETTNALDSKNRYWSSSSMKYFSNKLGNSMGINARPGFTPYADLPGESLLPDVTPPKVSLVNANYGYGRYYSEAIDDNAQTIFLRFGVPAYSSLLRYFSSAFDYNALSLVRTGSISVPYTLGEMAGMAALFMAFPVLYGSFLIVKGLWRTFAGTFSTRFYTLKPTMHVYWTTVNRLVNYIAVNKGFIPKNPMGMYPKAKEGQIGDSWTFNDEDLSNMSNLLGSDVFTPGGAFDMFAIATKAQRRAMYFHDVLREKLNSGDPSTFVGFINHTDEAKKWFNDIGLVSGKDMLGKWDTMFRFGSNGYFVEQQQASTNGELVESSVDVSPGDKQEFQKKYGDQAPSFGDYFDAEMRDGSAWAVFKVDYTGSQSESFTNSTEASSIASQVNSLSATARDFKFTLNAAAESIPGLSTVMETVTGAVAGVLGKVTFGLSNLLFGLGVGFVDVPKQWSSSSSSMPGNSVNYNLQLVSPYGNPYSQLQNQIVPLCMLMAAGLPRATGSQSHGSPFICQLFDKGRTQIRVGMITSLSITRGTTSLGFSKGGIPMGIECQFKVEDLSTIMAVPVTSGSVLSNGLNLVTAGSTGADSFIDEDNPLTDYLAVLAGMDIYSQIYPLEKAKLRLAHTMSEFETLTSPAAWASWVSDSTTSGDIGTWLTAGIFKGINTASAGNAFVNAQQ